MTKEMKSYLAGFLDGDGSIHIRIKPNSTYRYRFQISPAVVFYQSKKEKTYFEWLKSILGRGYIRTRNDGIVEYVIGDKKSILWLVDQLMPYLILKKRQAELIKEVISLKEKVNSGKDFFELSKKIDEFQVINYSKKRIQNSLVVKKVLEKEGLLTP